MWVDKLLKYPIYQFHTSHKLACIAHVIFFLAMGVFVIIVTDSFQKITVGVLVVFFGKCYMFLVYQ